MYRLEREQFVGGRYAFLWSLLAFQAGFINAFGFLVCGRFVSHVTGFGTQIGVALAQHKPLFALELVGLPLSFIAGSFVNGLLTSARIERQERPRFELVTFLLPCLIGALLVLGQAGMFGAFGEEMVFQRDFALLFLLAFVCGMQNGCFAVLTRGQIRTTHLTGISTDLGTDLARICFGRLRPLELELTRKTNVTRLATFVSFAFGSVAAVAAGRQWEYGALAAPLATSIAVFFAVRVLSLAFDRRFEASLEAAAVGAQAAPAASFRLLAAGGAQDRRLSPGGAARGKSSGPPPPSLRL